MIRDMQLGWLNVCRSGDGFGRADALVYCSAGVAIKAFAAGHTLCECRVDVTRAPSTG